MLGLNWRTRRFFNLLKYKLGLAKAEIDWSKVKWLTQVGIVVQPINSHDPIVTLTLGIFPPDIAIHLSDHLKSEGETVSNQQVRETSVV